MELTNSNTAVQGVCDACGFENAMVRPLDNFMVCQEVIGCQRRSALGLRYAVERHPLSERFHALLLEAGRLHDKKQHDYGTDENPFANICASTDFGVEPWVGSILRGNDKMNRIKSFIEKGKLKNESLRDSLMDLGVYSFIAIVLLETDAH